MFNTGRSLDLWEIGEKITAKKLNENERKYGGIYYSLNYNVSDGGVLFNSYLGSNTYGNSNSKYGYLTYGTAIFNNIDDDIELSDFNPVFTSGNDNSYNSGMYGYISYG